MGIGKGTSLPAIVHWANIFVGDMSFRTDFDLIPVEPVPIAQQVKIHQGSKEEGLPSSRSRLLSPSPLSGRLLVPLSHSLHSSACGTSFWLILRPLELSFGTRTHQPSFS